MAHNTLDCGALAALAVSAYQGRGLHCYTVQLVQQYSQNDARNWLRNWEEAEASANWISDDVVYHEACAVVRVRDEIRIWDPTASWWISSRQFAGYGAILALRVLTPSAEDVWSFHWGHRRIAANQWQHV